MALVVGLATIIALLKTQGVMMQYSYVSLGARNSRKLGDQFIKGISFVSQKGIAPAMAARTASTAKNAAATKSITPGTATKAAQPYVTSYPTPTAQQPGVKVIRKPASKPPTGTTFEAPKVTPRNLKKPKGKL